MIKFASRQNLKYPLQLLIWNVLRDIEFELVDLFLHFNSIIYTPIMFLGEFFAGLIIYLYQKQYIKKDKIEELTRFSTININRINKQKLSKDNKVKIYFLIFNAALCDFINFIIALYTPRFMNTSISFESRLRGIYTIYNALFYYFILGLPILKHQFVYLIIIGICELIVIINEWIFQEINIFLSYGDFTIFFCLLIVVQFISAMIESIEKYLFEFNNLNPFFVLMFEGLFGFLLTFVYSFFQSPFVDIIQFKKSNSSSNFSILIIVLIVYLILSGLKNAYRVLTNKIYTPMTTTFMFYIFNPFFLSYYFAIEIDFISLGTRNITYFIINLIISIILSFIGCVYNEFLIIFFCGLEHETHREISIRSNSEIEIPKMIEMEEEEEVVDNNFPNFKI